MEITYICIKDGSQSAIRISLPPSINSTIFCWNTFFTGNNPTATQIVPASATISKANVVLSPVAASSEERLIPRKFTLLIPGIASFVAEGRKIDTFINSHLQ